MDKTVNIIKHIVGLFFPMPYKHTSNKVTTWETTFAICKIPFGWIIFIIALLVKHLPI